MTFVKFRNILMLCTLLFAAASLAAQKKSKLIWHDEFNGEALDEAYWNVERGQGLWGNNELQHYTRENLSLNDGCLVISARNSDGNFSSARINTNGKFSFRYGTVEARIKLPYGNGMWPAFWMMGSDLNDVGHPRCGEIDILEMVGGQDGGTNRLSDAVVYASTHKPDENDTKIITETGSYAGPHKLSDGFHVYGMKWTKEVITFYVDGTEYFRADLRGEENNIFRKEYFFILNLAIGGNWAGAPTEETVWPQEMLIDWIRVYE